VLCRKKRADPKQREENAELVNKESRSQSAEKKASKDAERKEAAEQEAKMAAYE